MKIQAVRTYNYTQPKLQKSENKKRVINNTENRQYLYPTSYVNINFRSNSLNKLWDEYNWYIRHDKTPAIFSFLKIINRIKCHFILLKECFSLYLPYRLNRTPLFLRFVDSLG